MLLWYCIYFIKGILSDVCTFEEHRGREEEVIHLICTGYNFTLICPDRLKMFTRLRRLVVVCTSLSAIPDGVEHLQNLEIFEYFCNTGIGINNDVLKLAALKKLVSINLSDNNITEIPACLRRKKKAVYNDYNCDNFYFSNLQELNFSDNQIERLPSSLFTFTLLEKLDVSKNNITNISPEIGRLSNLKEFICKENMIKSIPNEIGNLLCLEVFDISQTGVESISDSFFKLVNLKTLNLSKNPLKILSPLIGHLTVLVILDISYNQLETLPETMRLLKTLTVLNASHNMFITWPDKFRLPKKIILLDISYNSLIALPKLRHLKKLTNLNISFNHMQSLSSEIGTVKSLETLDASFNIIKELPDNFGDLECLVNLVLSNNALRSLPASFSNLKQLLSLNLEKNLFNVIPFELYGLLRLKKLIMVGNKIESLINTSSAVITGSNKAVENLLQDPCCYCLDSVKLGFLSLMYLEFVDFDNNKITEIPSEIKNLKRVRVLSFAKNKINKISEEIGELKNLRMLNLRANKLRQLPFSIEVLKRNNLCVLKLDQNFITSNDSELGIGITSLRQLNFVTLEYQNQFTSFITIPEVLENIQRDKLYWNITELQKIKLPADVSHFSKIISDKQMRRIWRVVLQYFIVCEKREEELDSVSSDEIAVGIEDKITSITSSDVFHDLKLKSAEDINHIQDFDSSRISQSLTKRVSNFLRERSNYIRLSYFNPTDELLKNYIKALFFTILEKIVTDKFDFESLEVIKLALTDLCENKLFECIDGKLEGLQYYYSMFFRSNSILANSSIINFIRDIVASAKETTFVNVTNGGGIHGVHAISKWRGVFSQLLGITSSFINPVSLQFLSINSKSKKGSILNEFFNRFQVKDVCKVVLDRINSDMVRINETVHLLKHITKKELPNEDDYDIYMNVIKLFFEYEKLSEYNELIPKKLKQKGVIKIFLYLQILILKQ